MLTLIYLFNKAKDYVIAFPYKQEALIVVVTLLFCAGLYRHCASAPAPGPQIDFEEMQRINSRNEQERRQALEQVIEKIDDKRELRDDEIEAIERRIVLSKEKTGQNITAEELERLISQYR